MASMYNPAALTGVQRWGLLGASLRDIGASLNGDGESGGAGGAVGAQQALIAQGQTDAADQAEHARNADAFFSGDDPRSRQANFLYKSSQKFRDAYAQSIGQNYRNQVLSQGQEQVANDPTQQNQYAPITYNQGGSVAAVTRDAAGNPTLSALGQIAPGYDSITKRSEAENRVITPGSQLVHVDGTGDGTSTDVTASVPATNTVAPSGGAGDYAATVRQLESSGNDAAQNGSSTGRYQFQPKTFASVLPGGDINNPADQDVAMQRLTAQNYTALSRGLGRKPSAAELYLAHQQGAGGALALLQNPNALATSVVPAANVMSNGGTPDMTAGQFAQKWMSRYGRAAGAPQQSAQAQSALQTMPGARVIYSAPPKPQDAFSTVTGADAEKLGLDPTHVYNAKTGADMSPQGQQGLTPEGIEGAAQQYAATGVMPQLGQGKAGTAARTAVLNRAAQIDGSAGLSGGDAAAKKATFKTNAQALSKVSAQRALMEPAAGAALATLDKAIEYAKQTNTAAPNIPLAPGGLIQGFRINQMHDPRVVQLRNLVGTAASEYAKVIAGSTGSAPSSDATQREARGRINEGMTLPQLQAARSAIAAEMDAKLNAVRDEQARLQSAMSGKPARQQVNQQLIQRSQQNRDPLGILN